MSERAYWSGACAKRDKGRTDLKCRGVAQPGRVLALGARCHRFKSYRPDQYKKAEVYTFAFFVDYGRKNNDIFYIASKNNFEAFVLKPGEIDETIFY